MVPWCFIKLTIHSCFETGWVYHAAINRPFVSGNSALWYPIWDDGHYHSNGDTLLLIECCLVCEFIWTVSHTYPTISPQGKVFPFLQARELNTEPTSTSNRGSLNLSSSDTTGVRGQCTGPLGLVGKKEIPSSPFCSFNLERYKKIPFTTDLLCIKPVNRKPMQSTIPIPLCCLSC